MDFEKEVKGVTYSDNKNLIITVDNIGILADYTIFDSPRLKGGFGSVWLKDISLDQIINLRDQLTKVIDDKVATLNSDVDKIAMEVADCMDNLVVKQ